MHEVSLGYTLRDYLTGEQLEATTFEDLRQALARMLVEERGYPASSLRPRVQVAYDIDGEQECRTVDLVAYDGKKPLLLIVFCSGQVGSYERESVAAARLLEGGPAPLVAVTDTRDAELVATASGTVLAQGMQALPGFDELAALAASHPAPHLSEDARMREARILHAYTGFLKTCCTENCPLPDQPGQPDKTDD